MCLNMSVRMTEEARRGWESSNVDSGNRTSSSGGSANTFSHRAVSPALGRMISVILLPHLQSRDQYICFILSTVREWLVYTGSLAWSCLGDIQRCVSQGVSWEYEVGRHTLNMGGTDHWPEVLLWRKRSELSIGFLPPCFLGPNTLRPVIACPCIKGA